MTYRFCTDDEGLKRFCKYLGDDYIDKTSKFNPKIWHCLQYQQNKLIIVNKLVK